MEKELSLGEKMVRTNFNATADSVIDVIKQDAAKSIDYIELRKQEFVNNPDVPQGRKSEAIRLCAMAQRAYEDAAMYAVKAVTTPNS